MAAACSSSTYLGVPISRFPQVRHEFNRLGRSLNVQKYKQSARVQSAVRTGGVGFGKRPETKAKPKILKELDVGKVEKTEKYKIFVRRTAGEEALSKWEKLGEIIIEAGASIDVALKERKSALMAGVKFQYPMLVVVGKGEELQYGIQIISPKEESSTKEDTKEDASSEESDKENQIIQDEITVVDLSGKQPEETVPAILRVNDGKPPGKSRKF